MIIGFGNVCLMQYRLSKNSKVYLIPYKSVFNPALSLQQIVGINPYTGERPLESQNMIQILITA